MLVGIIDLGVNNLTSVQRAFFTSLGKNDSLEVIDGNSRIKRPDLVILPGLGKFATGMAALEERKIVPTIKDWNDEGTKIVGICLGMQLLGTCSDESPGINGLGLLDARIERLPRSQDERIPHTGWSEVNSTLKSQPFKALQSPGDYYFVHSYHFVPTSNKLILTTTPFGESSFVSSVLSASILGLQFHPEKSGGKGKTLISEIIHWGRDEI